MRRRRWKCALSSPGMSPAASTKSLSYHCSGSQEEFAHPHSLKIRSFLGDSDRSLRKDRFYRTAPTLPKLRISQSTGTRRPAVLARSSAFGGMLLRRAIRILDILRQLTVSNSRIFSALKASYECGRQFERQVSRTRSHRRGRSASIVCSLKRLPELHFSANWRVPEEPARAGA